jgi:hypothetical protein
MSAYGFTLTLSQADATKFASQGYVLAVQKSNNVNSTPGTTAVQWISTPVLGTQIIVQWTEIYSVYFTNVALVNGATITQSNHVPALTGTAWTYDKATFAKTGTSAVGTISITNGYAFDLSYGLSQTFTDPVTGDQVSAPIAATTIFANGGQAVFEPFETLNLYFTQTAGVGIVSSNQSSSHQITLTAGTFPSISYNNGVWTDSVSLSQFTFEGDSIKGGPEAILYDLTYVVTLAAPEVSVYFINWLRTKFPGYSITASSTEGSTIKVRVGGTNDPTPQLLGLKGQVYSSPPVKTLVD